MSTKIVFIPKSKADTTTYLVGVAESIRQGKRLARISKHSQQGLRE